MRALRPSGLVAVACLACGARTALTTCSNDVTDAGDASTSAALSVALGSYPDCTVSLLAQRPNVVGSSGGAGSVTLTRDGDAVVAALSFAQWARGSVTFSPSASTAATLASAQSFEAQVVDPMAHVVTVDATSGLLSLVGATLFLSMRGVGGDDDVSAFVRCRVPTSLPAAALPVRASQEPVSPGVYRGCAASSGSDGSIVSGLASGTGTVTVTEGGGELRVAWSDAVLSMWECEGLRFERDASAAVSAGAACTLRWPCGPPPTLGMSSAPSSAPASDPRGVMRADRGALFIDLVGDASAEACGRHDLSIACPAP